MQHMAKSTTKKRTTVLSLPRIIYTQGSVSLSSTIYTQGSLSSLFPVLLLSPSLSPPPSLSPCILSPLSLPSFLTRDRLKIALAASISLSFLFSSSTRRCRRGVCTTSGNLFSCDWQADSFSCERGAEIGRGRRRAKEKNGYKIEIPPPARQRREEN